MNAFKDKIMHNEKWKNQRERRAFLALADGTVFRGWRFGAAADTVGEVVFNTAMSGYQEIVTDPSYAGQFVTLTAPEIGNYGCCAADAESRGLFLRGLVVHNVNAPSNFRAEQSLDAMLRAHGVPGIAGVDTRRLTLHVRKHGAMKAYLHTGDAPVSEQDAVEKARAWQGLDGEDYAAAVTTAEAYAWNDTGRWRVVALDFGIKRGILRALAANDMRVRVVPAATRAEEILALRPDGVFLSNGPGDPGAVAYAAETIRALLGRVPLMGICMGHQLLSIALGARCGRLRFGHHGANHPVQNLATGRVEITSQNHNFAVLPETLPRDACVTHTNLNDGTVEGLRHKTLPAFGVQYHPEAAPGPHDSQYLFDIFKHSMEEEKSS